MIKNERWKMEGRRLKSEVRNPTSILCLLPSAFSLLTSVFRSLARLGPGFAESFAEASGAWRSWAVVLCVGGCLLISVPAFAQYTASSQTNTITGVTSNWTANSGSYIVGSNYVFDALIIITNSGGTGGVLSNSAGTIGNNAGANSNTVLVTGSGSKWANWASSLSATTATATRW